MRFATVVALAFGLAPASGLSVFRDDQSVVKDNLDVPGDSPLKYCEEQRDDDIILIQSVDLSPNPPQACVYGDYRWGVAKDICESVLT